MARFSFSRMTRNGLGGLQSVSWLLLVIWLVHLINSQLGLVFNGYGIYPREIASLPGVLVWPLLHGNVTHLLMNSAPLLVLGFFVALRGPRVFFTATVMIAVVAGLGVWLIGRPAYHIGASGLVFGYFGFLIAVGFYEKSTASLLVAMLVMLFYGGMLFGVVPQGGFVSWEGHLCGLLAGVLAARLLARQRGQ